MDEDIVDVLAATLRQVETYLVERGIEYKGTVGRTQVLPAVRSAIAKAEQYKSNNK